jgi:hypothetical protein
VALTREDEQVEVLPGFDQGIHVQPDQLSDLVGDTNG